MPGPFRRHPRLTLAGIAAIGVLSVALMGATMTRVSKEPPAPSGPTFTYARAWTLLELQRHIEAGEVIAVTAAVDVPSGSPAQDPNPATLVAKTRDGQLVKVALSVATGDALSALSGLGYGSLLTDEAWSAARAARPPAAPSDPIRSLVALIGPIVILVVFSFILFRVMRRTQGAGRDGPSQFTTILPEGQRRSGLEPLAADPTSAAAPLPAVRLADVAGCDEAKLELTETIEFLKSPERFHKLGARIPRGIMLYGPPGTGKTMLARAVAAEAGVAFHYTSGSEFVEKYVGVGAKRIRDLFAQARKLGRGVIFFDEFDALGKARGTQNSHEEREQTLNQLLVELDGFSTTDDVVVIAATNRLDILDSAVLRPGRFNRKIHVGLPDVAGRREILDVHARNKPLAADVDLESVARKTYGFSGAQLADLLNEAAIMTARRHGDQISVEDLHAGWLKVAVGTSRRRSMDERERSIIAAHEVGHAICGKVHGDKRKVEEISLFAHGEALGVTVSSQEDNDLPSESDLRARLIALMGGRAAEELLFHEVTGGASNDFDKANQIATQMVTKWGMGRDPEAKDFGRSGRGSLSFLVARQGETQPSEIQAASTRAIRAILDEAYAAACETLMANMVVLRRIAAYLVEHERVDGDTFDELFDGRILVPNAELEWRAPSARPRAWADVAAVMGRLQPKLAPATAVASLGLPSGAHLRDGESAGAPVPAVAFPEEGSIAETETPDPTRPRAGRSKGGRPWLRVRHGSGPRLRGPQIGRRLRNLAAGYLHQAEGWLLASEVESDES